MCIPTTTIIDRIVDSYPGIDPAKGPVEPQYLLLVSIKDVRREASVRLEHLPRHGVAYAMLLLCEISNVVSVRIHDDIAIRLLKAHEDIHHLQLPLDDEGRVIEESHGWVGFLEDGMRVFGYMNRCNEVVFGIGRGGKRIRNRIDF